MAENMWEKYRDEREKNQSKGPKHGKQTNQKLKPYVVLEYLMKYSDENNTKRVFSMYGGEFGFGAEIGISTQKLHARGPMGLAQITSYKYIINGNGQIR